MKTIYLILFANLLFSFRSFSQNTFPSSGNVGIGTNSPQALLDVKGSIQISNASIPMGITTEIETVTTPILNFGINFRETTRNATYRGGGFRIDTRSAYPLYQWLSRPAGNAFSNENVLMVLTEKGALGIGTSSPDSAYKLSVNGKIRAKEVQVSTSWADYVFNAEYRLSPLSEVAAFISEHKHLPNVPTEQEVRKKGINVGEAQTLLLEKVEELTLYLIEKDKQVKAQQIQLKTQTDIVRSQVEQLKAQSAKNNDLDSRLKKLERLLSIPVSKRLIIK